MPQLTRCLSPADLPAAELAALCLDGELRRVGDSFASIDEPETPELRALSLVTAAPPWAIVERFTALWVYTALLPRPAPHQFCVEAAGRHRAVNSLDAFTREVAIDEHEIEHIAGLAVTSPLRTLVDIVCLESTFTATHRDALTTLMSQFDIGLPECQEALSGRRSVRRRAAVRNSLERLSNRCERPDDPQR